MTLLLQRYASPPRLPLGLEGSIRMHNLERNVGPAVRWLLARDLPDNDIFAVLDDDFTLEPSYIEATTAPIRNRRADAVGWYGMSTERRHYDETDAPTEAVPLRIVAGGGCAMRVRALRGLTEHPLAGVCSTVDGGDDIWTSAVLRRNKARMIRPAGRAPFHSTEHQSDHRSIRWSGRVLDTAKLYLAAELFD